jgi:hypothetical protein
MPPSVLTASDAMRPCTLKIYLNLFNHLLDTTLMIITIMDLMMIIMSAMIIIMTMGALAAIILNALKPLIRIASLTPSRTSPPEIKAAALG